MRRNNIKGCYVGWFSLICSEVMVILFLWDLGKVILVLGDLGKW